MNVFKKNVRMFEEFDNKLMSMAVFCVCVGIQSVAAGDLVNLVFPYTQY